MNIRASYIRMVVAAVAVSFSAGIPCGAQSRTRQDAEPRRDYKIKLNIKDATVKNVAENITRQLNVVFSYESALGAVGLGDVAVENEYASLTDILDAVFATCNISYKIVGSIVVLSYNESSNAAEPSRYLVRGIVSDGKGFPVAGAAVTVNNTRKGVTTNMEGVYTIEVSQGDMLKFHSMGFASREARVGLKREMNVVLAESDYVIDEILVVGYGTQRRDKVTSAIVKLDGTYVEKMPVNSLGEALKGQIPGMQVATTSWQPGTMPKFLIRGGSSINLSQDPIILVDGVERELEGINNRDIESIEVLKDAAAAGIYGSRASNGVILVTMSKGAANKEPKIVFSGQWGVASPGTRFDLMNGGDYITTIRPAIAEGYCGGGDPASILYGAESAGTGNMATSRWTTSYIAPGETMPAGYKSVVDPVNPDRTIIYMDNDQQSQWFRNAFWKNYHLKISGGNTGYTYNASAGYTDDGGIGIATGYSRFTFHGNTSLKITDNIETSAQFDYSQIDMQTFSGTSLSLRNSVIRGLSIPATHRDWYDEQAGEELAGTPALGTNNTTIPVAFFNYYYNDSGETEKRSAMNFNLAWEVVPGLKATGLFALNNRHKRSHFYVKDNPTTTPYVRPAKEGYSETERKNLQLYTNYDKDFDSGYHLGVTAGYDWLYITRNSLDARVQGAESDKLSTLNTGTSIAGYPRNTRTREALISYYCRFNWDYEARYLATASVRADGSSKFAAGNRWGYFPAASLGWVASNEPFWPKNHTINMLKLYFSYGFTGNNGIGLYDAYGSYDSTYTYNGKTATLQDILPNSNLTWETTRQANFGIDAGLFENRLRINLDLYDKVTRDLLLAVSLPNTTGMDDITANMGSVRFYGVDFGIATFNVKGRNFQWTSRVTYNYNMNRVLELPDNGNPRNRIFGISYGDDLQFGGIAEGERMGRIYGYKVSHIIENQEQADAALYDALSRGYRRSDRQQVVGRKDVGDYEWVNRSGSSRINGQEMIDEEDQFLLGYALPHSTGGIFNTFRYKNWTLGVTLDYALGHSIQNEMQMRYFTATMGNCNYNLVNDVALCWKQPGDDTKYARFTANDSDWGNSNYSRMSDVFVEKGDYLCIRDISVSYSLPASLLKKVFIKELIITLTGNTLHYFTAVSGVSPEAATTGSLYESASTYATNYNPYPPTRKIIFGVNVTF